MSEVDNEKDIARQMVMSVQQQIISDIQTLEDKIKQTNIFIFQVQKINKDAEVYSKVGEVIHHGTKESGGGGPKQADGEEWEAVDLSAEKQNLTEESAYR